MNWLIRQIAKVTLIGKLVEKLGPKVPIDSIRFLKTQSCFVNKEGFRFTDGHNTLGVIYIVRDPRNIITSFTHHFQQTPKQSLESLLSHQSYR